MLNEISEAVFVVEGRVPAFKNCHEIHFIYRNDRYGKKRRTTTIGISDEGQMALAKVKVAAIEQVRNVLKGFPLQDKQPFGLEYTTHVHAWNGGDVDGVASTILDACQHILYNNDLWCLKLDGTKMKVSKESPEQVIIRIYAIDLEEHVLSSQKRLREILPELLDK